MVLSDEGIKKALACGDIEIEPLPEDDQYQTSSVDIFSGTHFVSGTLRNFASKACSWS